MFQLLMRDFYIHLFMLGLFILFPLVVALLKLPTIPFTTYIVLLYILLSMPFYYEKVNHVNRFVISLPVKKNSIVLSRYVFFLITITILLTYIFVMEPFLFNRTTDFSSITIMFIFSFIYLVMAVALPVYYLFDSIYMAIICQFMIAILGSLLTDIALFDPIIELVLDIIDLQPHSMLLIISIFLLFISYRISCAIFARRDLA